MARLPLFFEPTLMIKKFLFLFTFFCRDAEFNKIKSNLDKYCSLINRINISYVVGEKKIQHPSALVSGPYVSTMRICSSLRGFYDEIRLDFPQ